MREPTKDKQTVTSEGDSLQPLIEGLIVRRLRPIEDKRGDITELYDSQWLLDSPPLVYAYQVTLRPGAIRGWEMHKEQTDRICTSAGSMRWAFFDNRPDSRTYEMLTVLIATERDRKLIIVPPGVVHAVENLGPGEAVFINLPTKRFNHEDPDKYRFPLKSGIIPFDFDDSRGW